MADRDKIGWEAFMKTGRVEDYLRYKGYQSGADTKSAADTPDMQTGYTGRATDGGAAQRYYNTRN